MSSIPRFSLLKESDRMKQSILLVLAGSMFLILLLIPSVVLGQGAPLQENPLPHDVALDCRECHEDVYINWEQSAHGRGLSCGQCHLADQEIHARQGHGAAGGTQACMSCHTTGYDPITDTWVADHVSCLACHNPVDPTHPEVPAPTDRSADLCGRCHIQANFEWQSSSHGEAGVTCVSCHSQHTTSLLSTTVSGQCANCHESYTVGYTHSVHYEEGLSCANCHLAPQEGPVGEGSSKRQHRFDVSIETCVACHGSEMHNARNSSTSSPHFSYKSRVLNPSDAMASAANAEVSAEPEKVGLLGFVTVGGITLGLGGGGVIVGMAVILIPSVKWINRKYRHIRRSET
jgi:hypothetical protein